jgi:integrase
LLHQLPFRAHRVERLQQQRPQQPLRRDRRPSVSRVKLVEVGSKGGFGEAFSKWFGRYKRSLGIVNEKSVFHSFRHGFKDALRGAGVNEDVNDALTGHGGGNPVARGYGSDNMVRRFGISKLNAAVEKAQYPGLDLSHLRWTPPIKSEGRRSANV